ncbi:MAG: hypothetical protein Q3999_03460 [Buchananella hordeovulneris]|nr:hypothetical protein [Buchananella hordeovulneris]
MKRPALTDKRRAEKLAVFEELVEQRRSRVASVNRWAAVYRFVFFAAVLASIGFAVAAWATTWPWVSVGGAVVTAGTALLMGRQLTDRWVAEDKALRAEIAVARQEAGVITTPRGLVRIPVSAQAIANGSAASLTLPPRAEAVGGGSESIVEAVRAGEQAELEAATVASEVAARACELAAESMESVQEVAELVEAGVEAAGEVEGVADVAADAPAGAASGVIAEASVEAEAQAEADVAAPVAALASAQSGLEQAGAGENVVHSETKRAKPVAAGARAERGWTPQPLPEPTYARQAKITRRVANPYDGVGQTQRSARHEGTPVTAADLREMERTLNGSARLDAETAQMIESVLERRRAAG